MKRIKFLCCTALFLALPLLLGGCLRNNDARTSTTSDLTAKLAETKDPWKKLKMNRADKEACRQNAWKPWGRLPCNPVIMRAP